MHYYDPAAAADLSAFVEQQPRIVFEAHSTDYQTEAGLHALVRDHFAILKVGPAADDAFHEAVFALAMIEDVLLPPAQRSNLIEVLDRCMVDKPASWRSYYPGDEHELRLLRAYSLSFHRRLLLGTGGPGRAGHAGGQPDRTRAAADPAQPVPAGTAEGDRSRRPARRAAARSSTRFRCVWAEYARACNRNKALSER